MEALVLEVVILFIFVCRRPQAGTNLKLRDLAPPSGCLPLFQVPQLTPYWATLGRRSSPSYRTWDEHGWCPMASGVRLLVPAWHEPESDRSYNEEVISQLQRQGERERERERDHHVQQRSTPISNTMASNGTSSIIDASSYTRP